MSTFTLNLSRVLGAMLLAGVFVSNAMADDVPRLSGKPSKEDILRALNSADESPAAPSGMKTRGLSLNNAPQNSESAPAAKPEAAAAKPAKKSGAKALDLDVPFEFNSASLTQDGKDVLAQLADALASIDDAKGFVVEGHTDGVGNPDGNKKLSLRRAMSAKNYLMGKGVASAKMKVVGKGATELAEPNDPESAANRRVRIIVMY